MSDLIDRRAAIDALMKRDKELRNINWYDKPFAEGECKGIDYALEIVNALPSAQPEIIRCKDCKHWRDSDGVYRRGVNAESKCPLNTKEVYAGTFYCGYAERRTDG